MIVIHATGDKEQSYFLSDTHSSSVSTRIFAARIIPKRKCQINKQIMHRNYESLFGNVGVARE